VRQVDRHRAICRRGFERQQPADNPPRRLDDERVAAAAVGTPRLRDGGRPASKAIKRRKFASAAWRSCRRLQIRYNTGSTN
jgi:hypothetical protein